MPELPEKGDRWLYWQGRAEAALGEDAAAAATFRLAARQRSFWGMLAADRLGLPYALEPRPVPAEPARVRRIVAAPAVARIRALDRVGRDADMRREWRLLTRDLETPDLLAAAVVADGLQWHDQAIFTLARTDYWDDLVLRFPLAYREVVAELAWQTALPEDWIYAVIRQESVFNPTVASHAGALGLMQLMPDTAREVAAGQGLAAPSRTQILEPGLNLRLGSDYLARMRDRFGHAALATAAYNAGPQRVARWVPAQCTPADLWIVAIPFAETRAYVERVLAYRIIYRARLGLEPVRLSELLPPVGVR
jgi:soluble lytic murein transglycosylase